MPKRLDRVLEWMLAIVLIAVGLAGIFHEVLHKIGVHIAGAESLTLYTVGGLALALGIERFTLFADIERQLSSSEKHLLALQAELRERLTVQVFEGYDSVYNEAGRLLRTAESSIRTLVYAKGPTAPRSFFNALAERMQQEKLLTYHVTVAVDISAMTSEMWGAIEKRDADYRDAGIADRVRVTIFDSTRPVGFDVMVIDDRHAAMALSAVPVPEMNKEFGIHFENQPRIAKRIRAWLENLTPQVVSLDEARKRWAKKHRG